MAVKFFSKFSVILSFNLRPLCLSRPLKKKWLKTRQPLEVRRDYYNDQQAILARDNEEATLRGEMTQQMVRTLLNQARSTLEKSEK